MDPLDLIYQGKVKRFFRATRKLTQPGVISHITQRAAGKEPVFLEDDDYLLMLGLLKKGSEKHGMRIFAFCLMQNHIHLLVRPERGKLQDPMRDFFLSMPDDSTRSMKGRATYLQAATGRRSVLIQAIFWLSPYTSISTRSVPG
jgi:hypothetical protein